MNRLRRLFTILLCAGILLAAPMREAQAIPLLDQALKILTVPLVFFLGGDSKLQAALMVVNTKLPIALKMLEIKQEEKLAKARDANELRLEQQRQSLQTNLDHAPDPTKSNCVAITGGSDIATVEAAGKTARKSISQQFNVLRGRGWSQTSVTGKPENPVARRLAEDQNTVCNYGTPNDAAAAARCKKTEDEIKNNAYAGANTNAMTLLNTNAFNEDRHFVAAMDYCYALAGNVPDARARGRSLTENIDNIQQFHLSASNLAAQDVATQSCAQLAFLNLPIDSKFAKTSPNIKQDTEKLTSTVADAAINGSGVRDYDKLDQRARTFLIEGCGYTETDPVAKVAGEPSADANKQLIKGQKVSAAQIYKSEYMCKWYSKDYLSKSEMNKKMNLANVYVTRLYAVQLQWKQYEQMEQELLTEAVMLAQQVRQVQRDGPNSAPN